jgi:predicted TIM-barrel fold metal-dependent hydrolase
MPADVEPILEPDLPIIDPHHHLWVVPEAVRRQMDPAANPFLYVRREKPRYLLDELLADLNAGHDVRATVFVQCHSMYRADGPVALRPVGEVEFVNGVAAMSASGTFGPRRACAGIVGHADLRLGAAVEEVLLAEIAAGGGRFRGVRHVSQDDPDPYYVRIGGNSGAGLLGEAAFREGFARLQPLGLSFDAYLYEPQIGELTDLARAFPETQIILNHTATPLGLGGYAGSHAERFPLWRAAIGELAGCANVVVKLGGLGMPVCGFPSYRASPPASSEQLAREWAPYFETCIEAFGADRCMFESNFPTESGTCDYVTLWNAFKRVAQHASADEKAQLFFDVAARVYRLDLRRDGQA